MKKQDYEKARRILDATTLAVKMVLYVSKYRANSVEILGEVVTDLEMAHNG